MRFIAAVLSLSLLLASPGSSEAIALLRGDGASRIPTLTGPFKSRIQPPINSPLKLDTLKVSMTLENSLHVIDPVLQAKASAITPAVLTAAKGFDNDKPLEMNSSLSSALFDNAKTISNSDGVFAASGVGTRFSLAKSSKGPAPRASEMSWGDKVRELGRLKAEAKSLVGTKVRLAVGSILTLSSYKLLALTIGYWGLGVTSLAVLFIAGKLMQAHNREKNGRRQAGALAQELKGGAPSSHEVVALIDDIKPALEKVLARAAAPELAPKAAEIKRFLDEVETGERKNWSLTAAATNIKGTAEPLIEAYRNSFWDDKSVRLDELMDREAQLAGAVERLNEAAEIGDRFSGDLRFLAERVSTRLFKGSAGRETVLTGWKIGVLQKEAAASKDAALYQAMLELGNSFVSYTVGPNASKADRLTAAFAAALQARRGS